MKYAIKVPIARDDYIYVTRGTAFDTTVVTYPSYEAAKEAASMWGPLARIVNAPEPEVEF